MKTRIALGALLLMSFGCSGSSSSPTPTLPSVSGPQVSIVGGASTLTTTAFAPNPDTVAAGGTVVWMNNDNTTHTATSDGRVWDSGPIAPGGTFSQTFPTAGTFPYHCSIHPGMTGTITVQ
jgi:plastocyanin